MLRQKNISTIETPMPLTPHNDKGDKVMRLHRFRFTFVLLICLLIPLIAVAAPVDIPDPNLRAKIETALGKQAGDPITPAEMAKLTQLTARNANITDLTGLEHATNLTWLYLTNNSISDISAVSGLTHLTSLGLYGNSISDISAVVGLTNLTGLLLRDNNISDISPIADLTNLTVLGLSGNAISDISAVAELTHLTSLGLYNNTISDISAVAELTKLTNLSLHNNTISDISAVEGLTNLTNLGLLGNNISDISAVGGLTNLTTLQLWENNISDISAVAGLTKLTILDLWDNNISDISALEGLTNLTNLSLQNNTISDISPVVELTKLTTLDLWDNNISDISAVAELTKLTTLRLNNNSISDISAVAGLTNLATLWLWENNISDILPLVENTGLGSGDEVNVRGNPLNYPSITTHIPALQERGVAVEFTPRTPTTLKKISGTITESNNVLIVEVRDSNGQPFAGVPVTFTVTVGGGTLSATSTTTDTDGRAESTLIPGADGENTVSASVEGISETVTFSDEPEEGVHIPDPNLRTAIESTLNKQPGGPITADKMANLTRLSARYANISNLTGLEHATNLTWLYLGNNSISDISALEGLTNLRRLYLLGNGLSNVSALVPVLSRLTSLTSLDLGSNGISDVSALSGLTNLTWLSLDNNSISDISALEGLTNLTGLYLSGNGLSDVSALVPVLSRLTSLTSLDLGSNGISDVSALSGFTNLTSLYLWNNSIADISPLAGFTNLTWLSLWNNSISDISAVAGLTNLTSLNLDRNSLSDISPVTGLTNLTSLWLKDNNISDISPLVTNTGLGSGDTVYVRGNPLSYSSFYTHIPTLQSRGVEVQFDDTPPSTIEFDFSVPSGISLIHVPLKVKSVDGKPKTIESVGDLYDALGGSANVSVLITYNTQTQRWNSYLGDRYRGRPGDRTLTDDLGIIASMKTSASVRLSGDALGTNGSSSITLQGGLNLVGVPLKDPKLSKVSDLFALEGIENNVSVIIVSDNGFKLVTRPGDAGDVPIMGGQSFIMTAQKAATATITGTGWFNVSEPVVPASPMASQGVGAESVTPVLALTGSISPVGGSSLPRLFRITLKNLSTGTVHTVVTDNEGGGYQLTVVDLETGRAAQIGDILEITAQSPDPSIRVQPLRYTVTAEDVKRNWIQFGELVAYEIPAQTELLLNYPNPFNPETWIPYHLAHATDVTLTIYDTKGALVRRLKLGHQPAGFYTDRAKAAHWNGRNEQGESVASGVYFYHLRAGDYKALRRMVIVK